ncbi:MoaB/Mog domain-containing protein [Umbelopsis sp. AD052]|nr:MoaB/Mog domain-containing protein [Umbelopsis sp. AD052]
MSQPQVVTAACCIIGDEILNGKTRDSNANYLAKMLFDLGVELKRIEVISDDRDEIAETVRNMSNKYDLVFTSGGIGRGINWIVGPTLDDITYSSIAHAFGLELKLDDKTCQSMIDISSKRITDWSLTEARKRMVIFPHPAEIVRTREDMWVPIVVVNSNVHILPGIPKLFENLADSLTPRILNLIEKRGLKDTKFYRAQIATSHNEGEIAPYLLDLQGRASAVKIGSYPKWGTDSNGVRVVVSVIGRDEAQVQKYGDEVQERLSGWKYQESE